MKLSTRYLLTLVAILLVNPVRGHTEENRSDKSQYNFFNPTPKDLMRGFQTDRPDKTEAATSIDAGHYQHETDLINVGFKQADGDTESLYLLGSPNFKIGLTNRTDLQFVMQSFTYRTNAGKKINSGNGDLLTRVKVNLWGNDEGASALSVMPYVKIPINYKSVGNTKTEGGLIFPFSYDFTEDTGIGLMTQYDLLADENDSGYNVQFVNSATIGTTLWGDLGGYVEIWTAAKQGTTLQTTLDCGLTYMWNEYTQLDIGLNTGVSDAAVDYNPFIGISQRF